MPKPPLPPGMVKESRLVMRLKPKDVELVHKISKDMNITISNLIRKALIEYIKNNYKPSSGSIVDLPDII